MKKTFKDYQTKTKWNVVSNKDILVLKSKNECRFFTNAKNIHPDIEAWCDEQRETFLQTSAPNIFYKLLIYENGGVQAYTENPYLFNLEKGRYCIGVNQFPVQGDGFYNVTDFFDERLIEGLQKYVTEEIY